MRTPAIAVAALILVLLNGAALPGKQLFAAEKTVRMNVPGCMT